MKSALLFVICSFLCLGLVHSVELDTSNIKNAIECAFCDGLVSEGIIELEKNSTTDELVKLIVKGCKYAPVSYQQKCADLIKFLKFHQKDLAWLINREEYTPLHLCQMTNFCSLDCCVSDAPEQVHIALAGDAIGSMAVSWVTRKPSDSLVFFGKTKNNLAVIVNGSSYTDTKGGWKGMFHKATLNGLIEDTTYYYQVGGKQSGFSKIFSFRTFPSKAQSYKFGVIGDMGVDPQAVETVKLLTDRTNNNDFDVLVHVGDISYSDGYQGRWDQYFRFVEPVIANVPYMVCPGNHEIGFWNYLGLYGYKHRFLMPNKESGTADNTYYSWNYGPVHWISLNTESSNGLPLVTDTVLQWAKKDLIQANKERKVRPWIIVYFHRPLYCGNEDAACTGDAEYLRGKMEDLFYQQNVSLIIAGHKHDYERTTPLYKSKIQPEGTAPVYLINGAGGNREDTSPWKNNIPEWSVSRAKAWGYGILDISPTILNWNFYLSSNNTLYDSFSMKNSYNN